MKNKIICGNCKEALKEIPDSNVHAIVTDPPYELGFMGKKWDNTGIAYDTDMWKQCLRVLKPGGHLIAFGGARTYHRMTVAIEDAGFEIRDMIEWVYNTGFPKSQNIGKMYDKKIGNERTVVGYDKQGKKSDGVMAGHHGWAESIVEITKGTSPYEGLGTALKPAHEPMCFARKPISEKTIVDNVIHHGTGGLNIDECRIPPSRFPANVLCQDDTLNDGRISKGKKTTMGAGKGIKKGKVFGVYNDIKSARGYDDNGSNSRFFDLDIWAQKNGILQYPKPASSEKGTINPGKVRPTGVAYTKENRIHDEIENAKGNNHPTVKPLKLMSYLITLISRPGDTVLDPFAGSGTTLVSANNLGRDYIGIEITPEYIPIIEERLKKSMKSLKYHKAQQVLF